MCGSNGVNVSKKKRQLWSLPARKEVVLRILSGESLDEISRETGVEVYRLEAWRNDAQEGMEIGLLGNKNHPSNRELDQARNTIDRLTMELDLSKVDTEI
jgi:transposase-like protein